MNIRSILIAGASLAMAGQALAADLPSRRAPPVYVPPPLPVFTWTGGYFGINAGYAFDNHSNATTTTARGIAGLAGTRQQNSNGFTGGGQIGYNYQLGGLGGLGGLGNFGGGLGGGLVVGVEADAAYTDLNKFAYTGANLYHSRLDYLGTVRGRVGIAFDRVLVYGTGGFAYGGLHQAAIYNGAFGATSKTGTGYTYGGGVEYALPTASFLNFMNSSAVTVKAEYLHYDLGRDNLFVGGGGVGVNQRIHTDGNLVRAGLNFKFGTPALAPVVARY